MGIALPQLAPASEDRVSGSQVISGSLRFVAGSKEYLSQTIGNGTTGFTLSFWMKPGQNGDRDELFDTTASTGFYLYRHTNGEIKINSNSANLFTSNGKYRDVGAWYHILFSYDSTSGYGSLYVNGKLDKSAGFATQLYAGAAKISSEASSDPAEYYLSQWYLIDGVALGPGYFGYTDPLTNTWRPKKFKAGGTTYNNGTTWSSGSTVTGGSISNAADGFDGDLSSSGAHCTLQATNTSTTANVTFAAPLKNVTKVEVFVHSASSSGDTRGTCETISGETLTSPTLTSASQDFHTIYEGPEIDIVNVGWGINQNGATGTTSDAFRAFRVNGIILKDSTTTNVDFGTNGFYLPLDGSSSIGADKSGQGNDWTPNNFGGSITPEKATGAKPVLNTSNGGRIAAPGVFGSKVSNTIAVTVSNATGNNKYYFDTVLNPTLALIRGSTITFDTTDSSNNSHPFKLSSSNADSSGGTEYTDGVAYYINGSTVTGSNYVSNYSNNGGGTGFRGIKWTVPHNVSTTYYYCTQHNGMGNNGRLNSTTDETKADPYAWKCVLAMPLLSGVGNDLSNQINAASSTKTVTVTSASSSASINHFYGASTIFDGSNDKIDVADSADFDVESGDWCAECWFYTPSSDSTSQSIFRNYSADNSQFMLGINSLQLFAYLGNTQIINAAGTTAITAGKWAHLALTHDDSSSTTTLYINGVAKATSTTAVPADNHNGFFLGHNTTHGSRWITGNYQDVRFYKGTKKYTGSFIPASPDPNILPDSPSGVAIRTKLPEITNGSVYFDGSDGRYCTDVSSSDLTLGTGDFTVECFANKNNSNHRGIWQISTTAGGLQSTNYTQTLALGYQSDRWQLYAGGSQVDGASPPTNGLVIPRKWYHLAVVRHSGTTKLYVDGRQEISTSDTYNYNGTYLVFGGYYSTSYLHQGYISNFRVVKGTALYTSEFTPPNRKLTNVTNTKFLAAQSSNLTGSAAVSPQISGVNDGTVWSEQNTFTKTLPGTTETGSLGAVFNPTTGTTGAVDSFGYLNGAFDFTYTPDAPIPYSSKVRVWTGFGGSVYLNNGSAVSAVSNNWTTLASGSSGSITSIRFQASGSGGWWSGLEVDDTMLVDPVIRKGDPRASTLNPIDTNINIVRGKEGNYATFSPYTGSGTKTNGNLDVTTPDAYIPNISNIAPTSGKWYAEIAWTSGQYARIGVQKAAVYVTDFAENVHGWRYESNTGNLHNGVVRSSGQSYGIGTVVGIAMDLDTGRLWVSRNGVWQNDGNPATGRNPGATNLPFGEPMAFACATGSGASKFVANFGQKPFKYAPPEGFQPLTASILRPDTIDFVRPEEYVSATTYSGNNGSASSQVIGGIKHRPDLIWIKERTSTSSHFLFDTVRGAGKYIMSNESTQEQTLTDLQSSFNSDGFTVGNSNGSNEDGQDYIAWTWKAGGGAGQGAGEYWIDGVNKGSAAGANMSVGALNSTAYNKASLWRNNWTASGNGFGSNPVSQIFDATFSNYCNNNAGGQIVTWNTTSYSLSGKLRIRCSGTNYYIYVNGKYMARPPASPGEWVDLGSWTNLIQIQFAGSAINTDTGLGSAGINIYEIEVDGKTLIDSDVSINSPTIAATGCSVGTKQGFSIIKYTGGGSGSANSDSNKGIPHGLSQAPDFVIGKRLSSANDWMVYHSALAPGTMNLTSHSGNDTSSFIWAQRAPSKNEVFLGNNPEINASSSNYIAYCWHNIPGLQRFGSYEGISSDNGQFIDCGFRPAMILIKRATTHDNGGWHWYDNARDTVNPAYKFLLANKNYTERRANNNTSHVSTYYVDFLSNGFRLTHNSTNLNDGSVSYIYAAWAESPQFNLFGAQSSAR